MTRHLDTVVVGDCAVTETPAAAPLVSIAIPTVNRLGYLKEAVGAALAQTYSSIEVLIGDECVSHPTGAWAQQAAEEDTRIRYRQNPRRLGLAGNWNALADAARGEFIVIIGDDDRLLPTFVETLMYARTATSAVVFANHYLIDAWGNRLMAESLEHTRRYHRHRLPRGVLEDPRACVWRNSIPMSAALVRTDAVRRRRFNERLNTPEIEFFVRLVEDGAEFVFVPDYVAEYRVHSQSATAAGLRSEDLAQSLLAIPVSADVEPYKRTFMSALLVGAVGRCLEKGDTRHANMLRASPYYMCNEGRGLVTWTRRMMHKLCGALSPRLSITLYGTSVTAWRSCRSLAHRVRSRAKVRARP